MSEDIPVENKCPECPQEAPKLKVAVRKKRDIFRFNGQDDMALNFDLIYKVVRSGKRITFQASTADFVDFEDEEVAKRAFEQIINIWAADVLE